MSEIAYRSEIHLIRDGGPMRRADLPGGEQVTFGVHGAVADHYGVSPDDFPPTSTTLDYLVASAVG